MFSILKTLFSPPTTSPLPQLDADLQPTDTALVQAALFNSPHQQAAFKNLRMEYCQHMEYPFLAHLLPFMIAGGFSLAVLKNVAPVIEPVLAQIPLLPAGLGGLATCSAIVGLVVAPLHYHFKAKRLQKSFQIAQEKDCQNKKDFRTASRKLRQQLFPDLEPWTTNTLIDARNSVSYAIMDATAAQNQMRKQIKGARFNIGIAVIGGLLLGAQALFALPLTGALASLASVIAPVGFGLLGGLNLYAAHQESQVFMKELECVDLKQLEYAAALRDACQRQEEANERKAQIEAKAKMVGQDPVKRPLLAQLFNVLAAHRNKENAAQAQQLAASRAPLKARRCQRAVLLF